VDIAAMCGAQEGNTPTTTKTKGHYDALTLQGRWWESTPQEKDGDRGRVLSVPYSNAANIPSEANFLGEDLISPKKTNCVSNKKHVLKQLEVLRARASGVAVAAELTRRSLVQPATAEHNIFRLMRKTQKTREGAELGA